MGGTSLKFRAKEIKRLIKAQKDANRKWNEKNWFYNVKQNLLETLKAVNPLKAAAVVTTTVIIKFGIDWTQYGVAKLLESITRFFPVFGLGGIDTPYFVVGQDTELLEWVLAFGLAYLIVEHFDAIVVVSGDIISSATKLLGAFTAAAGV